MVEHREIRARTICNKGAWVYLNLLLPISKLVQLMKELRTFQSRCMYGIPGVELNAPHTKMWVSLLAPGPCRGMMICSSAALEAAGPHHLHKGSICYPEQHAAQQGLLPITADCSPSDICYQLVVGYLCSDCCVQPHLSKLIGKLKKCDVIPSEFVKKLCIGVSHSPLHVSFKRWQEQKQFY